MIYHLSYSVKQSGLFNATGAALIILFFFSLPFLSLLIFCPFSGCLFCIFLHFPQPPFVSPSLFFPQLLHFFCLVLLFPRSLSHDFDLSLFSLLVSLPHFLSLSLSVCLSPKALSGGAAVEEDGSESSGLAEAPCCSPPPPHSQSMPSFQFWPSPANRGINKLLAPFCQL